MTNEISNNSENINSKESNQAPINAAELFAFESQRSAAKEASHSTPLLGNLEISDTKAPTDQGGKAKEPGVEVKNPLDRTGPVVENTNRNETLSTGDRFTSTGSRVVFAGAGVLDGTGGSTQESLQTPDGYRLNFDLYDKWGNISRSTGFRTPDGTTISGSNMGSGEYGDWSITRPNGTTENMPTGIRVNNFSVDTPQGPIQFSTGPRGALTISTPGGGTIVVGDSGLSSVTRNNCTSAIRPGDGPMEKKP